MRTQKSRTVGVVVSEMSNPFFQEIFDELIAQFARRGWRTMVWHAGTHAPDAVAAIRDRAVDGVVFSALSEGSEEMQAAVLSGRPVLLLNRTTDTLEYDCVTSDNAAGGRLVAEHLIAAGRTDAALICGDLTTSTGRDRRAGFLAAMAEHGTEVPESHQHSGEYSAALAAQRTEEHLERFGVPQAFFCSNDAMAIATLNTLHAAGVRVPEDTWVIGYDDVGASAWTLISLTTVSQSSRDMAREGAELLLRRLEEPGAAWQRRVFEPELIVRGSTGG